MPPFPLLEFKSYYCVAFLDILVLWCNFFLYTHILSLKNIVKTQVQNPGRHWIIKSIGVYLHVATLLLTTSEFFTTS
jgi:hypothetical protein